MTIDLPSYINQERVECSIQAANHYHVPALVLLAVAEQEGGRPGQKVRNRNGTYDYGVMQINTVSLADLRKFGIHEKHVLAKGCYPYFLAAWRIAGHIKSDSGDIWQRAANYHSRTPYFNRVYRAGLLRSAAKFASLLDLDSKSFDEIGTKTAIQGSSNDNAIHFKTNTDRYTAYSSPIKVKGFGSLNDNSLQVMQSGSISDLRFSWAATPSHSVNGW
jgi:hypothetical protein